MADEGEKEGKTEIWKSTKITKIWISWQQRELFQWNKKTFFIIFEGQ